MILYEALFGMQTHGLDTLDTSKILALGTSDIAKIISITRALDTQGFDLIRSRLSCYNGLMLAESNVSCLHVYVALDYESQQNMPKICISRGLLSNKYGTLLAWINCKSIGFVPSYPINRIVLFRSISIALIISNHSYHGISYQ